LNSNPRSEIRIELGYGEETEGQAKPKRCELELDFEAAIYEYELMFIL
jgi:hypothetical protein